jgi:hypothetical protein
MISPYDSSMTHYLLSSLSDAHSAYLLYNFSDSYFTILSTSLIYKKTAPRYLQSSDLS